MIENRLPTGNEILRVIAIGFLASTMLGFAIEPSFDRSVNLAKGTVDTCYMNAISNGLTQYANNHNGFLPNGENWIDRLIETQDMSPKSFALALTDSIEGESEVALNKAAAGKKLSDLPDDLVLIFKIRYAEPDFPRDYPLSDRLSIFDKYKQSSNENIDNFFVYKDRWNITCGPEKVKIHDFNMAALVTLADGSVCWLEYDKLHEFRWDLENSDYSKVFNQLVKNNNTKSDLYQKRAVIITPPIYIILLFIDIVVFKILPILKKYIKSIVYFCIISIFFACILGHASEWFHPNSRHYHIGFIIGPPVGLCAALCFSAIVLNLSEDKKKYIMIVGVLFGIICSSMIHISLAYTLNSDFDTIIYGMPFGIAAGYLLAWLFANMVNNRDKQPEPSTNEAT